MMMSNAINKLSYNSHRLHSLWEDLDAYIEGGEQERVVESISAMQESISELVDFVVEEMDDLEIALAGAEAELKAAKEKYQLRVDTIKRQIESRTDVLLRLREKDILTEETLGTSKRITFSLNPPKVEELLIDPSSPDFPEEFRETRIEYVPLKKELLAAVKRGKDVSQVAKISRGIKVSFKPISATNGSKRRKDS
jgi:hypothetical protein